MSGRSNPATCLDAVQDFRTLLYAQFGSGLSNLAKRFNAVQDSRALLQASNAGQDHRILLYVSM